MFILCDIAFLLFAGLYLPYLLLRRKWHPGFWTRMGFVPSALGQRFAGRPVIWFHAVSVGELMAVAGLIQEVMERFPDRTIVVSTVTTTGYDLARRRLPPETVVIYAPLDLSFITRRFVRLIRPQIYVTAETELWPNLFLALHRRNVPVVMVNGRISERSFAWYKLVGPLLRPVLWPVKAFCVQTPRDAQRLISLGSRPQAVHTVGNLKFDDLPPAVLYKREELGFAQTEVVWIAASTHPGEEDIVLRIYPRLKKDFLALRLIVAPRHIERADEVEGLIRGYGFAAARFSRREKAAGSAGAGAQLSLFHAPALPRSDDTIMLVDTIGHLRSLYSLADLVFVGKSLAGRGGQNMIEPAFFGKPVVVGPHTENFPDIMAGLLEARAVLEVKDSAGLEAAVRRLLGAPGERERIGRAAQAVIQRHRGATAKTLAVIEKFIKD